MILIDLITEKWKRFNKKNMKAKDDFVYLNRHELRIIQLYV